jgi:hypothetical protein
MRASTRLLILALSLAVVSCSGGALPVVRDYTSNASPVNAKPQSVIPPGCDNGGVCIIGGGGGGCDVASRVTPISDCSTEPIPGYNVTAENICNQQLKGIYISLYGDPASSAYVSCATALNTTVSYMNPQGCPDIVQANYDPLPGSVGYIQISGTAGMITQSEYNANHGIRVAATCTFYIDGVNTGTLSKQRHT